MMWVVGHGEFGLFGFDLVLSYRYGIAGWMVLLWV